MSRRATTTFARVVAGAVAVAVFGAACGASRGSGIAASGDQADEAATTSSAGVVGVDPLLFLSGRAEVVALHTSDGSVSYRGLAGMAAPDRSAIAQVVGRQVVAVDPATGEPMWTHPVSADRRVRVVAPGARLVALVDGELLTPSDPRTSTEVVVADTDGTRTLTIAGNVDPEAFTTDGRSLVVVEYLPAEQPDHYAVRLVDLASGEMRAVPDQPGHHPDQGPRERMAGYARTQVASPDGRFLYTYYASPEGVHENEGSYYAFVHVLDLDHGWAYCIDLEAPFGTSPEQWSEPALTLTPDGTRLLVADRLTGALTAIDTDSLEVLAATTIDPGAPVDSVPTAAASDDVLYLGMNRELLRLDTTTLDVLDRRQLPSAITGLKVDRSGTVLYVVTAANVSRLSPDGVTIGDWPLPVAGAGADPAVAIPASGAYKCAC